MNKTDDKPKTPPVPEGKKGKPAEGPLGLPYWSELDGHQIATFKLYRMAEAAYRVRMADVFPDGPEQKRFLDLTDRERAPYLQAAREWFVMYKAATKSGTEKGVAPAFDRKGAKSSGTN